jgi:hypothetical protein
VVIFSPRLICPAPPTSSQQQQQQQRWQQRWQHLSPISSDPAWLYWFRRREIGRRRGLHLLYAVCCACGLARCHESRTNYFSLEGHYYFCSPHVTGLNCNGTRPALTGSLKQGKVYGKCIHRCWKRVKGREKNWNRLGYRLVNGPFPEISSIYLYKPAGAELKPAKGLVCSRHLLYTASV